MARRCVCQCYIHEMADFSSVGNLHGHEEYNILFGLNEAIFFDFQFCFEEKPGNSYS